MYVNLNFVCLVKRCYVVGITATNATHVAAKTQLNIYQFSDYLTLRHAIPSMGFKYHFHFTFAI